jgi:hypothetical protein
MQLRGCRHQQRIFRPAARPGRRSDPPLFVEAQMAGTRNDGEAETLAPPALLIQAPKGLGGGSDATHQ